LAASHDGPPVTILRWRGYANPTGPVVGLLDIELASGLQILDVRFAIGARYIMPPAAQVRDRDDRILLDDRGRPRWRAFVDFRDKYVRQDFSEQVLASLLAAHPELFAGEAGR
jgi:hypothetical protein